MAGNANSNATFDLSTPTDTQTYYETICEIPPLARKNYIVSKLSLYKRVIQNPETGKGTYELVVANVIHRRYDIPQLPFIIEMNPYSSSKSDTSESFSTRAESNANELDAVYQKDFSEISNTSFIRSLVFNASSGSKSGTVKPVCLAEELFRLIAIISRNTYQYSTHKDASHWFAETIMETAEAIFQPGWLQLFKPESECNRDMVAAYRAHQKKFPIPIGRITEWQATQLEKDDSTLQAEEEGQPGKLDEAGGGGGEGRSPSRGSRSLE
jgi:hypothetical protein